MVFDEYPELVAGIKGLSEETTTVFTVCTSVDQRHVGTSSDQRKRFGNEVEVR